MPCGTTDVGYPLGFDATGRALIVNSIQGGFVWVRSWDPTTGAVEEVVPPALAARAELSLDGRRVMITDDDAWFQIFDLSERRFLSDAPVSLPADLRNIPRRLALSHDGEFVLDGGLRRISAAGVSDLDFGQVLKEQLGVNAWYVAAAKFMPGASSVAALVWANALAGAPESGPWDEIVAIVPASGPVVMLPEHAARGSAWLSVSPDGRHVSAAGIGAPLQVWEIAGGRVIFTLGPSVLSARFTARGRLLVERDSGAIVEMDPIGRAADVPWATGALRYLEGVTLEESPFRLAAVDASGARALVLGERAETPFGLLAVTPRDVLASWRDQSSLSVAVSGSAIYTTEADPDAAPDDYDSVAVARYDAGGGPRRALLRSGEHQSGWVGQLVLAPGGQRVAAVLPDSVRILDAATLAEQAVIRTNAGTVAWSPDGRTVATTPQLHYRDEGRAEFIPRQEIQLWDAGTGSLVRTLVTPRMPLSVGFDGAGAKLFVSGVATIEVRDLGLPGAVEFNPVGPADAVAIDLVSGQSTVTAAAPLVAVGRGLGATRSQVVSLGSGEPLAALERTLLLPDRGESRAAAFASEATALVGVIAAEPSDELPAALSLALFDAARGRVLASVPPSIDAAYLGDVAISSDGRRVAVSNDGATDVYCFR